MSEPGSRQYRCREVLKPEDINWEDWEKSSALNHGWNSIFLFAISFALLFRVDGNLDPRESGKKRS
jgi:hypothetical protein